MCMQVMCSSSCVQSQLRAAAGTRLAALLIRTLAHKKPLGLWVMKDPTDLWVIGQQEVECR